MASISRDSNGRRTIQFVAADGKRKSTRLGKVSQRAAKEIRTKVEYLSAALASNCSLDNETAQWVAKVGDDLADKFAAVGPIPRRAATKLGEFLAGYITRRSDVKPRTRVNLEAAKARLIEFFGGDKNVRDITPATLTPDCSGSRNGTRAARPAEPLNGPSSSSVPRHGLGSSTKTHSVT